MVVNQNKLKTRITQDKDFFKKFEAQVRPEFERLRGSGVSRENALKQIRARISKESGAGTLSTIAGEFKKQRKPIKAEEFKVPGTDPRFGGGGVVEPTPTPTPTPTEPIEEEDIESTILDEGQTLRERVSGQIAGRQTREEQLKAEREAAGRGELVELQKGFREEARAVQEDIEGIRAGLEAEGGAITNIAASRIREARSAPLREQLVSLVKGQELTSASLKELDTSIDGILEARKLDRQNEINNLTAQIEASDLSTQEKNKLIGQLGVQTKRMQREEEIEAFRQKEQIKADMEIKDVESLQKTGLTAEQALQSSKIIEEFDVKEDSIAGQSIRRLLKEGKTPEQIRTILGLAEDETGIIDDTQFTRQEKLRKEFEANATVKQYLEATQQFSGILSSLGQKSGPGDMAGIFQFMKALDPSSVVREVEFQSAAESSGILDRITSLQILKKAETGQILTPKQRQQFAQIAKVLFENRKSAFDQRATKFITLAKEGGANPRSVVLDFENIPGFASDLTEKDFAPIGQDSSDDEIKRFINKSGNTFTKDSDDADVNNFLDADMGLDSADLPAETKVEVKETITPTGKIGGILGPLQNKVTVVKKGGDNPVLGLKGGSLTFRTNNPLAITATQPGSAERLTKKFNSIPNLFSPDSKDNLVLNFKTPEEGLKAGKQLLNEKGNLTINELMESHTGGPALSHKSEARRLGINMNTKFKDLTEQEKNKVIEAIKFGEGFRAGQIIS